MIILFFICLFIVIYVYALFPLLISLVPERAQKHNEEMPPVTIICSAYNEEKVIAQKIKNFYELQYPSAVLFIGLDGCTDATKSIIDKEKKDGRVKVFDFKRRGKASVINELVKLSESEFIVATDANTIFKNDVLHELVALAGENTGVVCGKLVLRSDSGESGEGIYWKIETGIKQRESSLGLVMGANGAIYLFKKSLFDPLPDKTINDDFTISMKILQKGYSVVFAENAIAYEKASTGNYQEFKRHIRDSAGHFIALLELLPLLNPFSFKRFLLFVSHRVLRWFAPFFMLIIHVMPFFYSNYTFFKFAILLEAMIVGIIISNTFNKSGSRLGRSVFYFYLLNLATLIGFTKFITGQQKNSWSTHR